MRKTPIIQGLRILAIAALASLCIGLIVNSARSVRYCVDGVDRTEVAVTELSLTHNVEHAARGEFTRPYPENDTQELAAKKPAPKKPQPAKPKPKPKKPKPRKPGGGKACPT